MSERLERRAVHRVVGISSAFPSALTAPHYVGWDRSQNKAKPHKHLTHQRVWVTSASLRLAVRLKPGRKFTSREVSYELFGESRTERFYLAHESIHPSHLNVWTCGNSRLAQRFFGGCSQLVSQMMMRQQCKISHDQTCVLFNLLVHVIQCTVIVAVALHICVNFHNTIHVLASRIVTSRWLKTSLFSASSR